MSVAWGDVDGDGDLDLACGNVSGSGITIFLNEGGALATTPGWTLPAVNTYSLAWGDVDGDGDLDLAWGGSDGASLYLNEGTVLAATPDWSSGPALTLSVAWGDVDGDGDLDLACGNGSYDASTVYLNNGGRLTTRPAWSSEPANTRSVAWGDVDGDGDLDIALGGDGGATVYLNEWTVLAPMPAWSSRSPFTYSVAWGDVDGDGDLDLACGNNGDMYELDRSTVYLNEGGTLATTPAWSSVPAKTWSVVWGDADGDGDLDLASGNSDAYNYAARSTLYLNEGGILASTPAWSSESAPTSSLAWGDVDSDGDLDLACGNRNTSSTLYFNTGGILATTPDWSSVPAHTNSVAWGDVDGDGDPDLACGNTGDVSPGASSSLYLNEGGTLAASPSWSSVPAKTNSVAWGDVDGDGDLDLACGNTGDYPSGASSTLYLNEGGTLAALPGWFSVTTYTNSVAWGDVDGDGDLDLACGNSGNGFGGAPSTLYLNEGGTLGSWPVWVSRNNQTYSIAWGDVDGDGDPDLACGGFWGYISSNSTTLYLNEGGSLGGQPAWSAVNDQSNTLEVAWGDVDGDGDLDLACGKGASKIYLNEGGTLATTPAWFAGPASAMSWGDVDGDGDLDLACGSYSEGATLYLNEGGNLATSPGWSSGQANTGSVAWADVDGDGDLDLACGNDGASTLYCGMSAPVFRHAPAQPIHQLPNNGAHLRFVQVTEVEPNVRRVSFRVVDVESDPVFVSPQYRFVGDSQWHSAEILGGRLRVGQLASSPEGIEGTFDWDVLRVLADRRAVVLRLLVTEIPRHVSTIQYGAGYLKQLDPIEPHRPLAFTSATSLTFPRVTVGDTTSVQLMLANQGNEILQVSGIQLPSPEMDISPAAPFTIAPHASIEITVSLRPRTQLEMAGEVVVLSNDPLRPELALPIAADIRTLAFTAELLRSEERIPLGDAATVIVAPGADVDVERGGLYYRPAGSGAQFTMIELSGSTFGFTAIIPGTSVTEPGLEYYIAVENSGVFATAPPNAPEGFFYQPVQSPSSLVVSAQANSEGAFPQLREIPLRLEVTMGTEVVDGRVYYRPGGISAYDSVAVTGEAPLLSAIVPAGAVGPRGVEYHARLQTLTTFLTSPTAEPASAPHSLPVRMASMVEPLAHPSQRYRLFSIPLVFQEDFTGSLVEVLGGLGPYDPAQWRALRYLPGLDDVNGDGYVELSDSPALFRPEPGRGFWLITRSQGPLAVTIPSFSTPTSYVYEIELDPGWNQIGDPFAFPVAWASVQRSANVENPRAFDPTLGSGGEYSVEPVVALIPFEGYFVFNAAAVPETLRVPAVESPAVILGMATPQGILARERPKLGLEEWSLSLTASIPEAGSESVRLRVMGDAVNEHDDWDRRHAPSTPGARVSLAVDNRDWADRPGLYEEDVRSSAAEGHRWNLVLRCKERGEVVVLNSGRIEDLPPDISVRIVDREQGTVSDLRGAPPPRLVSPGPGREYRLALLAGEKAYVDGASQDLVELPRAVVLDPNAPNPFNPLTRIRFGLPAQTVVSLTIFDVRGVRVAKLLDMESLPAGYHILVWEGRDDRGRPVPSGVYFYRLTAPGHELTRKMVLVR